MSSFTEDLMKLNQVKPIVENSSFVPHQLKFGQGVFDHQSSRISV